VCGIQRLKKCDSGSSLRDERTHSIDGHEFTLEPHQGPDTILTES
jgi:hypothetical protein